MIKLQFHVRGAGLKDERRCWRCSASFFAVILNTPLLAICVSASLFMFIVVVAVVAVIFFRLALHILHYVSCIECIFLLNYPLSRHLHCIPSPCLSLSLLHWRQENLRLYLAFVDASSGQEESFWVREWGGSWGCGGCWNDRGDRESKKEDVWIASLEWTLQMYFSSRWASTSLLVLLSFKKIFLSQSSCNSSLLLHVTTKKDHRLKLKAD